MEMFNRKVDQERIGPLKKSKTLEPLREMESFLLRSIRKYPFKASYDVMAEEFPYFETVNYTEYATCFMIHPLNSQLRNKQMWDAYNDTDVKVLDFCSHLKSNIENKVANKYQDRQDPEKLGRFRKAGHLVVLAGSNKLKECVCLNKLKRIRDLHDSDVYYKPHPITVHAFIGELKDILGEELILPRDIDIYYFLMDAYKIYTTHLSESAAYAVALGKEIEPIDVFNTIHRGSFYHINRHLFEHDRIGDAQDWMNKTFSSPKSGIINPAVDKDWKNKIIAYLDYIKEERAKYKNWYIRSKEPIKDQKSGM